MQFESAVTRVLDVVDRAMRSDFPEDFDRRCMYGAFAVSTLLQQMGFRANIAGGGFIAFVVSRKGDRASMQGFGTGGEGPSHYWTEVEDMIVDLGPHYLPKSSSYPALSLPMVAWNVRNPLPKYLRYRAEIGYSPAAELQSTDEIKRHVAAFVTKCSSRLKGRRGQPKLNSWLLTGAEALQAAARRGDQWAIEATKYEGMELDLPSF